MSDQKTAKPTIHLALAAILQDVGQVTKDRKSDQNYKFRGIEDVLNALHPILAAHGVTCVPFTEDYSLHTYPREGKAQPTIHVFIRAGIRFTAADGSFIEAKAIGEGIDFGDKASAKAHSYALKTILTTTFSIPTQDIADSAEERTVDAASELRRGKYENVPLIELEAQRDQLIAKNERVPAELLGAISERRNTEADENATLDASTKAQPTQPAKTEEPERVDAVPSDAKTATPAASDTSWKDYILKFVPTHKGKPLANLSAKHLALIVEKWCNKYAEKIAQEPGRALESKLISEALEFKKASEAQQ